MKNDTGLLIETIVAITGDSQEQIAERTGYDPQYISQLKKAGSEKAYKRIAQVYAEELKNKDNKVVNNNFLGVLSRIEALVDVIGLTKEQKDKYERLSDQYYSFSLKAKKESLMAE